MEKIGEKLRKRRLEKMITLEEIEKNTRIRRRYLEAIENDEWQIFPGFVYLKGFVKTYCRYIGMNETGIIKALEERLTPDPPAEPLPEKIELPGRPRRKIAFILGIIAIIILIASQFVYTILIHQPVNNTNLPQASDNSPPPPAQPVGDPTGGAVTPPAGSNNDEPGGSTEPESTDVELKSLSLRIKVINSRCWVTVRTGNQLVFEGTLRQGEEKNFTDMRDIYMGLGNAGDVEVYLNEKDLGVLGAKGEVVYKRFIIENNQIKEINPATPSRTAS